MSGHAPITTLEEWDAIDIEECMAGYRSAKIGDPEPGLNHSRSFNHGWRCRMMDHRAIEIPDEHRRLVHWVVKRKNGGQCGMHMRGRDCVYCGPMAKGGAP